MKDDSFAEILAREGMTPPGTKIRNDNSTATTATTAAPQQGAFLPPDCGDDEKFAEMTRYMKNGVDLRRLKKLLREKPEVKLDLHGETAADAYILLENFLREQTELGRIHLEVVHGRGGHSADGRAVLRGKTRKWLAGCGAVLGFIEPQKNPGAVQVLLRRGVA